MKRNKLILIVLLLSIVFLLFSGCGEGGTIPPIPDNGETSDYFQLDVPYIVQNSDNTCLPASAAMVLKYYEDPRDIAEIRDKLALPWQEDGTGGIMVSGHGRVEKLFDYVKTLGFEAEKEWDGLTIEQIKNKLKDGFPIIVLQDFNLDEAKTKDGHFSVVVGYREVGDSDKENKLIINDPWSTRGQYWEVTYSDYKIRNSNWWKEQHDRDSDLSHSYIIWKDTSITNTYTITVSAGSNGSISPSSDVTVNEGSDQSFTITPDTGYQIDDVLVDGSSVGAVSSYTFTDVTGDHTISVTFTLSTATGSVHNLNKGTYYSTIQAALDDADNDNTIEVADGIYDESIFFPYSKKIILQSVNGASSTTIRGPYDGSPTVILNGSLENTTLEGFTITHTSGNNGSGIYNGGNLMIKNCTISGIFADNGGGIYNDGTLTITGSTIFGIHVYYSGGGIYNGGNLMIKNCTIFGIFADRDGGGICNNEGTITITGSTISNNSADSGGGIENSWGTITINGSTISNNSAEGNGGGIGNNDTLTITGSTISNNSTNGDGGGIGGILKTAIIGGISEVEKNIICGNYKTGEDPSLEQQITDIDSGSLYEVYKNTNYISAYCD